VAFRREQCDLGWSPRDVAEVLALPSRTLAHWCRHSTSDDFEITPRGRPPRRITSARRAEVTSFLTTHGPALTVATLRAEFSDVARAELEVLRSDFRKAWHTEHAPTRCDLTWHVPGSVWAMDFSHPPHRVDGGFPAILNVRDLASHRQLLWLPVLREDAATVVDALDALCTTHGPPLVWKFDNGPAFRAQATKDLARDWSTFPLYSPPYCAHYNGACERANRTLKEMTEHIADQAGRPGFWTSDDLLGARLRANRLSRPWGPSGPTPEEKWASRRELSLDERAILWQELSRRITAVCAERGLVSTTGLLHYTRAEIERIAAQPVLESLGLLHVTRRRVTPVN
jgi:transposase InsO family protein